MADPISGVGGRPLSSIKPDQAKQDATRVSTDSDNNVSNVVRMETDRVELSADAQAELDKAGFDAEKVERIKQALADGNYPIDARRIAQGFSDIEKLL